MSNTLIPFGKRIVVKPTEPPKASPSGVILIDTSEKPTTGKVVNTGKDVEIPVGVTVIYGKYAGTNVTVDGENLLVLDTDDVLALVH